MPARPIMLGMINLAVANNLCAAGLFAFSLFALTRAE